MVCLRMVARVAMLYFWYCIPSAHGKKSGRIFSVLHSMLVADISNRKCDGENIRRRVRTSERRASLARNGTEGGKLSHR